MLRLELRVGGFACFWRRTSLVPVVEFGHSDLCRLISRYRVEAADRVKNLLLEGANYVMPGVPDTPLFVKT